MKTVQMYNAITNEKVDIAFSDGHYVMVPAGHFWTARLDDVLSYFNVADEQTIAKLRALKGRQGVMTAEEFKAARLQLQLTQEQFGDALNIASNSVARIERGEMGMTTTRVQSVEQLTNPETWRDLKTFYEFVKNTQAAFRESSFVAVNRMEGTLLVEYFHKDRTTRHFRVFPSNTAGHVHVDNAAEGATSQRLPEQLFEEIAQEVQRIQASQ